jgi:hypothetical protein
VSNKWLTNLDVEKIHIELNSMDDLDKPLTVNNINDFIDLMYSGDPSQGPSAWQFCQAMVEIGCLEVRDGEIFIVKRTGKVHRG